MIFKAPLIAFQSELYAMLSNADEMTFSVYDSSMTIGEILNSLKNQDVVNYGVIAVSYTHLTLPTKRIV